LTEKLQGGI